MSEDQASAQAQQQEGQQQEIQIRDMGATTHYSNFFTATGGQDAVMLSFGNLFGGNAVVQIESKVVLSLRNTKRLALSLGQLIRRYEEQHGEIDIGNRRQPQPPQEQGE
jgi:hypothetical protein